MRFRAIARDFRRTLSRQRVYRMASSKMRRKILWGSFFAAVVALGLSIWQYRRVVGYLWSPAYRPLAGIEEHEMHTPTLALAILVTLIGIFAFVAILTRAV